MFLHRQLVPFIISGLFFLISCSSEEPDCRLDIIGIYEGTENCRSERSFSMHVARATFEDQLVLSFPVLEWPGVLVVLNESCDSATMNLTTLEENLRATGTFVFKNGQMTGHLDFVSGERCEYNCVHIR